MPNSLVPGNGQWLHEERSDPSCGKASPDAAWKEALTSIVLRGVPSADSTTSHTTRSSSLTSTSSSSFDDCYLLKEKLGAGAFGTVHRAVQVETGREVAVKIVPTANTAEASAAVQEYNLYRRLSTLRPKKSSQDSTFVNTHGAFATDAEFCMILDYLKGGTLDEWLHTQKLTAGIPLVPEKQVQLVIFQVLTGLAEMHKSNVAHFDIKPANLMFHKTGDLTSVRIVDMGLASEMSRTQLINSSCGTPHYYAPELVRARRWGSAFGSQVDLWATGVMMYQFMCGRLPFFSKNQDRLFRRILEKRVVFLEPMWEFVSDDAKDLLLRLLHKDPAKRINAKAALRHHWFKELRAQYKTPNPRWAKLKKLFP